MKTKYTKKQISEAIAYWTKQLKEMNENAVRHGNTVSYDMIPGDDKFYLNADEVQIIPIDNWKKDKLYPTADVISCPKPVYDWITKFLNSNDADGLFWGGRWHDDGEPTKRTFTPFKYDDCDWIYNEFGPNSEW